MNEELLYRLMPALYRQRDAGEHLQRYMRVLGSQFSLPHDDIEALLDNWFIEACDDWVVPYLGDLVQAGPARGGRDVLPGRRTLAGNRLAYRSDKGSLGVLEQAAAALSGWAVSATEGADALALVHSPQWQRPGRPGSGQQGPGKLHAVALQVCRMASYPVRNAAAMALGGGRYTFHPLGVDQPLFDAPPRPPRALGAATLRDEPPAALRVERAGAPLAFRVADLSGWELPDGEGAVVDPLRGRILLDADAPEGLRVSYHFGMSADLGGGPYPRASLEADDARPAWKATLSCMPAGAGAGTLANRLADPVTEAPSFTDLQTALAYLAAKGGDGVLSILDSGTYQWPATIALGGGAVLTIEAASGVAPAILGRLALAGGDGGGTLALSGLRCDGTLVATGSPELRLHHCTWLPGAAPSIDICNGATRVEMAHCITGPIHMAAGALAMRACIVDGGAACAIMGGAALRLAIQYCTVLGDARGGMVRVADSVVTGTVTALVPAQSHMRFSHAAPGPDAPPRHRCLAGPTPAFTSLRYGQPGYCQLGAAGQARCQGAEDGGEVGVFHALRQHQREAALRDLISEYLPRSVHASIYFLN